MKEDGMHNSVANFFEVFINERLSSTRSDS